MDKKVNALIDVTFLSFNKVSMDALDHLSCIFFMVLLSENNSYIEKSFFSVWSQEVKNKVENGLIFNLTEELKKLLEAKMDHLENTSFFHLCLMMANKLIIIYLCFLQGASLMKDSFLQQTGQEMQQIHRDVHNIIQCFDYIVQVAEMPGDLSDQLQSRLSILNEMITLLECPLM